MTQADRDKWNEMLRAEVMKLTPYERKVKLALDTFTPPPKVVRAQRPRVRKAGQIF